MQFPAGGLALGQGVAWLAARQWARAPGPEDWSVREPLPSTGQRCWSCSAVARRLRASQVPHTLGVPCLKRRRSICGGGSRRAPGTSALPPDCSLPLLLVKAAMWTQKELPSRPQELRADSTEAPGQRCETWGPVCSLSPRDFHFQSLHSNMLNSLQWSMSNPQIQLKNSYISHVLFCIPCRFYLHITFKIKLFGDLF